MFLGHYALALVAKRRVPETSLGVLVAAAQLPDLVWPVFLLLGWERVGPGDHGFTALDFTYYPWSHSLLMDVGWGLAAALAYLAWRRRDPRGAIVVALLVVSHWLLDFPMHRPDLPLYPGGAARLGLGLWNHPVATIIIEGAMWITGVALYATANPPADRTGRYAFWGLIVLLTAIYLANLSAATPTDMRAVAWGALGGMLVPPWAAWADRHRRSARA
jgi:hypothetical protein